MLQKIKAIEHRLEVLLTAVSWMVTIFLMLMIVVDVGGRFFLNRPLPATWEFGEICMPYIVFFPFAYALSRNNHVRVSLIRNQFPRRVQDHLKTLTDLISLAMCALLTYVSWQRFWYSYSIEEEMMAAVRILWWWGRIAMPIGMGLFTLAFFLQLFQRAVAGERKEI